MREREREAKRELDREETCNLIYSKLLMTHPRRLNPLLIVKHWLTKIQVSEQLNWRQRPRFVGPTTTLAASKT